MGTGFRKRSCSNTGVYASPLFLQAHLSLRLWIGGQFLRPRSVAVLAQQKRSEIEIGLIAELSRPVGRHRRPGLAEQPRHVSIAEAAAEIRAIERRPAEFAVVQRGAMAILAIAPVSRLAAFGLFGGERHRRWRDRNTCGTARRFGKDPV